RRSAALLNQADRGRISGTAMTLRSGPRPADNSASTRRAWRLLTVRTSVFSKPGFESSSRPTESNVSIVLGVRYLLGVHSNESARWMVRRHAMPIWRAPQRHHGLWRWRLAGIIFIHDPSVLYLIYAIGQHKRIVWIVGNQNRRNVQPAL